MELDGRPKARKSARKPARTRKVPCRPLIQAQRLPIPSLLTPKDIEAAIDIRDEEAFLNLTLFVDDNAKIELKDGFEEPATDSELRSIAQKFQDANYSSNIPWTVKDLTSDGSKSLSGYRAIKKHFNLEPWQLFSSISLRPKNFTSDLLSTLGKLGLYLRPGHRSPEILLRMVEEETSDRIRFLIHGRGRFVASSSDLITQTGDRDPCLQIITAKDIEWVIKNLDEEDIIAAERAEASRERSQELPDPSAHGSAIGQRPRQESPTDSPSTSSSSSRTPKRARHPPLRRTGPVGGSEKPQPRQTSTNRTDAAGCNTGGGGNWEGLVFNRAWEAHERFEEAYARAGEGSRVGRVGIAETLKGYEAEFTRILSEARILQPKIRIPSLAIALDDRYAAQAKYFSALHQWTLRAKELKILATRTACLLSNTTNIIQTASKELEWKEAQVARLKAEYEAAKLAQTTLMDKFPDILGYRPSGMFEIVFEMNLDNESKRLEAAVAEAETELIPLQDAKEQAIRDNSEEEAVLDLAGRIKVLRKELDAPRDVQAIKVEPVDKE